MKINTNSGDIRVADLSLLTTLGLPTALGFVFAIKPEWLAQWLATSVVLEAMYLWWLLRGKTDGEDGVDRTRRLRFGLRIQAQAGAQIAANMSLILAGLAMFGAGGSRLDPQDPFWQLITLDKVALIAVVLAKISVIASIGLAWARFHHFRKVGIGMAVLADDSFNHRVLNFPAAPAAVVESLLRHVDRLGHQSAPRYTRMAVQSSVRLSTFQSDGRTAFKLTWTVAPCAVKLIPVPADDGSTDLQVIFELRGGIYKTELFPNPVDVQALMNFMQLQIFQRMSSELILSNAVNKQHSLRAQAVESQLRILQAQIEPHFLFNTLANVRHLYRSSVDAGEEMMDHLIVYLRSTLEELRSDASTVGKEMDLILHYLAIMKIRMGDRLSYGFIVPDALVKHDFPPAMLISLVENAIKHGLHDRTDGKLTISCERDGQHLRVSVADNGAGFSSVEGSGVGLSNIRQRLEAMHGSRAWLEVGALADGGFVSTVTVPYEGSE